MLRPVVQDVLVDLVGDGVAVPAPAEPPDVFQLVAGEDLPGRIVWRVDDNRLGVLVEGGREFTAIDREIRSAQRHVTRCRSGEDHVRPVILVERLEDDHLVARIDHGQHRRDHRLGRAAGHRHLAVGVADDAVIALRLGRDRGAQLGLAEGDRVLVQVGVDGRDGSVLERPRGFEIGKALREVEAADRVADARHLADHRLGEALGHGRQLAHQTPWNSRTIWITCSTSASSSSTAIGSEQTSAQRASVSGKPRSSSARAE